tara:strand:+ start:3903 stop:4595 length:693 start_codon:yes stop_codon:yes gene_type:complete
MGYLDSTSVTVDAVLTKKGRELLKDGKNLNITHFTLSDTGVDYTLWNEDDPSGSAYYGSAIENLPQLEANVHSEYNLRNRLLTLGQNAEALPTLVIAGTDSVGGKVLTLNEGDESQATLTVEMLGYAPTQNTSLSMIVSDPSIIGTNSRPVASLSGTSKMFLQEQDIPHAEEYAVSLNSKIQVKAIQQNEAGNQTNIYFYERETGAYDSIRVVNNVTKNVRAILSRGGKG